MDDRYSQNEVQKSGKQGVLGLAVIAIVVIAAIIFLISTLKNPNDQDATVDLQDQTALSTEMMRPVAAGQFVYQFEGIEWQFEAAGENMTKVNMMFKNFSRRDGVFVTFGKPYKLGTYPGTCQEVETMNIDPEREEGIALSFAECWSGDTGEQIVLFQEAHDVVVKRRAVTVSELTQADSPGALPPFTEVYRITLTDVVR